MDYRVEQYIQIANKKPSTEQKISIVYCFIVFKVKRALSIKLKCLPYKNYESKSRFFVRHIIDTDEARLFYYSSMTVRPN